MEIFEFILDFLDKIIIKKAFDKQIKIKKRLPYIFLYYTINMISLLISTILGVNFIRLNYILGYFLILMSILLSL